MTYEWLIKYPLSLFREGSIVFPGAYAVEIRVAGVILLALAILWLMRRIPARISRLVRGTLIVLRVLAMALLLLLILPPVLRTKDNSRSDRFVVFLADDSRSMTINDVSGTNRITVAKRLLFGQEKAAELSGAGGLWQGAAELGGVRAFRFSDAVYRVNALDEWRGEGIGTDIYEALKAVDDRMRGVPLAAVVLVSDGAHTMASDPVNAAQLMAAKNAPVFTVGLGNLNPPPDREIVSLSAPGTANRPANVNVVVMVATHGYTNQYSVCLKQEQQVVGEVKVPPGSDAEFRQVIIPLLVDQKGVFNYTVEIPPEKDEKNTENNVRSFRMEVQEHRLPVLYVEGSPRTEFRFIRGALFRDSLFLIITSMRIGKDSPVQEGQVKDRFLVQGVEKGDPRYRELMHGFPTNIEHLVGYEAVILGDVEASMLTTNQMTMIEEFVATHGRGLLMLGGVNSFNVGGYIGTPVGNMLPVEMMAANTPYDHKLFNVRVAREGVSHPIMRQVDDPVANASIWNTLSPLMGHNPIKRLKPGGVGLLENTETPDEPVLAVQNYGAGRTAIFTTGGSWYWRMDREHTDRFYERFWRQLILWLAVGAKAQVTAQTDKDVYLPGEQVTLEVSVLNKELTPVDDANITAVIETPFAVTNELRLEWIVSKAGVYQARYTPREQGEFKVHYKVIYPKKDKEPELIIDSNSRFNVQEGRTEFTRSWQNQPLLKKLAEQTGGAYFEEAEADKIIPAIKKHVAALGASEIQGKMKVYSLWDLPVLLGLLVVLLLTEWFLRRRAGLP